MRKLSASVCDSDVLFGFDSNPDGRVDPQTNWNYMYFGPGVCIRGAGPVAGMTLIIRRDGTVLVERLTHHGLPGSLSSETKAGLLPGDTLEEVNGLLIQNEAALKRRFNCASWMGWPLTVAWGGSWYTLDREKYERSENDLKAFIRKLVPPLRKAGVAIVPGDFFC